MLNYANLNDIEFEYLCQDIMQAKLNIDLRRFAQGKDGGIDLTDNITTYSIVVQIKHYIKSSVSQLITSLKKELPKIKKINPNQYYICCSKALTPQATNEIYSIFQDYMESEKNIITLIEIDDFLSKSENSGILKKHYKLWIESTNILEELTNNDIFVDCEVLLSDIKNQNKFFVKTEAYNKSLECLEHNKTLFITGNPGVGKTMTSNMLALYYAANGYRIRYTTNNDDLNSLKKSLSRNPDIKELILVDDCFGQAYFQMKECQNKELLALIKYVSLTRNKLLILNSRVTIFQEAKERHPELVKSLENEEYKVFIIDMTAMSNVEKAKIFYNHLSFNNIEDKYFLEIKKDKRYRNIINHHNYNPRLVEFICNPHRYKSVPSKEYYNFILQQLNNPRQIWKDEYERKLQKTDRILLMTVYSLSDVEVTIETAQKSFNKRIAVEEDIDQTINQFEASLIRLMGSFMHIMDKKGIMKISMLNPSINDYLDCRMKENDIEKQQLIQNAYSIQQLKRVMTEKEFSDYAIQILRNKTVNNYEFSDSNQKLAFIAYYVSKFDIFEDCYADIIYSYLWDTPSLFFSNKIEIYKTTIIKMLMKTKICEFFQIIDYLLKEDHLEAMLSNLYFEELIYIIKHMDCYFVGEHRNKYLQIVIKQLEDEIEDYCSNVDADDYYNYINMSDIIEEATAYNEYDDSIDIDTYDAERTIEDIISDLVIEFIDEQLSDLPEDIEIQQSFLNSLNISINGISYIVYSYINDDCNNKYVYDRHIESDDEIDYIFER